MSIYANIMLHRSEKARPIKLGYVASWVHRRPALRINIAALSTSSTPPPRVTRQTHFYESVLQGLKPRAGLPLSACVRILAPLASGNRGRREANT